MAHRWQYPAIAVIAGALIIGLGIWAYLSQISLPQRVFNSLGMELVLIPAGGFTMGSSQEDLKQMFEDFKQATGREYQQKWTVHVRDEMPAHRVEISRPFYLQVSEVTNDQFAAFIKATGYQTIAEARGGGWIFTGSKWQPLPGADWQHPTGSGSSIQGKGSHPVVQVSWDDANAFCEWLSKKESQHYYLPSEAQWEYAARGGQEGEIFPWGRRAPPAMKLANLPDEAYAREHGRERYHVLGYDDGYADTAPVGRFLANGFGLHDMIGNVWEWCADWYDAGYYARSPRKDPPGPATGTHRVLRGGAFCYLPSNSRCSDRFRNLPVFRCHFAGFRMARSAPR